MIPPAGLARLLGVLRGIVRALVILAVGALAGVGAVALLLARGGLSALELVVTLLLLAAPAVVLLFTAGVRELLGLPERLRRLPRQGSESVAELTRLAAEARTTRWYRAPFLLWRLRGLAGSTRELVGFALPLRVVAPPFLALALASAFVCVVLVGAGAVALVVLAVS
jgi:hypothetical protein